ncbi:MAG: hypothetical protein M1837_006852 [Sclerophora amabilis]|nr:MAG: hypothetical protein M1837_006852 [Sclerophora amabilis]
MHRQSISQLVYNYLYPPSRLVDPRAKDPVDFKAHVTKYLVPEVRQETKTFYGTLDCIEARYPGLDYSHAAHRMRLGRFKHHERLFRAFNGLKLTEQEIAGLCTWEGTRSARENYEREEGVRVRDTTGDDIPPWPKPARPQHRPQDGRAYAPLQVNLQRSRNVQAELQGMEGGVGEDENEDEDHENEQIEDDDSEPEMESVGLELNRRLEAAAEASARGVDVVMDPEFEQWLKEASERGLVDSTNLLRAGHPFPSLGMAAPSTTRRPHGVAAPPPPRTGTAL